MENYQEARIKQASVFPTKEQETNSEGSVLIHDPQQWYLSDIWFQLKMNLKVFEFVILTLAKLHPILNVYLFDLYGCGLMACFQDTVWRLEDKFIGLGSLFLSQWSNLG